MPSAAAYAIGSVIVVSLISVISAIPLLLKKKVSKGLLLFLLSVSVGVLLSTVLIEFLPEALEEGGIEVPLIVLGGFLAIFVLEKMVHWHHSKKDEAAHGHSHAYNLAPINLIGDGVHNFIDGLVIAGAYAVNVGLGIAATVSVIFHEVPQEIADFGVLLYGGLTRRKAVIFNLLSAGTAILGAVVGLTLSSNIQGFTHFIIPFAAGNFLYIAASNLLPQLHRHCGLKDTVVHLFAILLGIGIVVSLALIFPGHGQM